MTATTKVEATRPPTCPTWCVQRHGIRQGEDDSIHVSVELLVRGVSMKLCATIDPNAQLSEGPYLLLGAEEYTLHEADALIDALTQLVDEGLGLTRREGA